jgi:hypothetical protein
MAERSFGTMETIGILINLLYVVYRQWDSGVKFPVGAVFLSRVPGDEAGREGPPHRILLDRDNRSGFVDLDGIRGQRYVYRVCAA